MLERRFDPTEECSLAILRDATVLRALACALTASIGAGCASAAEELEPRAAYDLQCPQEKISYTDLGGRSVVGGGTAVQGVSGCGKRATYVQTSAGWVMNTESSEQNRPGSETPGPAPTTGRSPLTGAAGFLFGAAPKDAESVCTIAGLSWQARTDGRFACSGAPTDVGFPARIIVSFCDAKICQVDINANPNDEQWAALTNRYKSILETLESKYGRRYAQATSPLDDCTGEVRDCFAKGRVRTSATWQWPAGHNVSIVLNGGQLGKHAELSIFYRTTAAPSNSDAVKPGL